MHSLLSLHAPARAAATDPLREVLMLQFLSLPVFQDPAPWNVVWRAGELFPIDVGDGNPNPNPNPNPSPNPSPSPNPNPNPNP